MEFKNTAWIGDDLLFINKSGVYSFNTGKELVKLNTEGRITINIQRQTNVLLLEL